MVKTCLERHTMVRLDIEEHHKEAFRRAESQDGAEAA